MVLMNLKKIILRILSLKNILISFIKFQIDVWNSRYFIKKSNKRLINKFSKISQKLSHRGPDSTNYYKDRQNLLIHTRLSIVDLKSGNQPITYKDKILVANGEIYNDPEIRLKLQKYSFKTKSDSESILALYNDEGLSGLKKLRGMYAFAIYDKKKKLPYYVEIYLG